MAEFTTRVRYTDEGTAFVNQKKRKLFKKAEYVYSWRSRRTKYDIGDTEAGTTVGIIPPKRGGTIFEDLAERKRYAEDIMKTLGGVRDNSRPPSRLLVCSVTDQGHPFTSVKWMSLQEGRYYSYRTATGVVTENTPLFAFGTAYRPSELGSTPGFASASLPADLATPSTLERNARLNPVFFEMLPTKQIAQIGETVVSLLRGEFPSIVRNLNRYLKQFESLQKTLKDAPKYAGGEYLNSVFGWTPLIRDFENAVKVLTTVDYLIYGTAYRRHRVIEWDTKRWTDEPSTIMTPSYGDGMATSSVADSRGPTRTWTRSYDIRLSARLVPIARPTIGANSFIDQASEKLQQLGIWYPSLGWDLLPYSWLVDWATSLGSSINNAAKYGSSPGQVNIDYAWATSCTTTLAEVGFANESSWIAGINTRRVWGRPKAISIAKTRFPATPWGFGLDLSALNAGQVAILVALGLAKRP